MKTYEKTNKEKMMLGEIYDANYDNELIKERQEAKDKCFKYNTTHPSNMEERKQVLKGLLGSIKGEFVIEPNFWCDYGYNIAMGENFYSNHNLVILYNRKVTQIVLNMHCRIMSKFAMKSHKTFRQIY